MPPVITNSQSIAAAGSVANLIAGSAFEFARTPELIQIGITVSATGVFCTITNGSDLVAEEFTPYVSASLPIIPDQMYFSDYAAIGDRLVIKARNPTGGAVTFNSVVQISNVG
jgi:hypothetical protein